MNRKYQIFISSTYIDLVVERADALRQILNDYNFPIGMEMFNASDRKQWEVIKNTINSSDIYILILGFRYGTVDPDSGISYTEKEYNYAISQKKPILVFALDDQSFIEEHVALTNTPRDQRINPKTNNDLLEEFYKLKYDRDQNRILTFRAAAMNNRVVEIKVKGMAFSFGSAIRSKISELQPAGWVREKDLKWNFFKQLRFYSFLLASIVGIYITYYVSGFGILQNRLIAEESQLFHMAKTENLEYARVLPDGQSLEHESSLPEIFRNTANSFQIMTQAFRQLSINIQVIDSSIKRGVDFKILLIDTTTLREGKINNFLAFHPQVDLSIIEMNRLRSEYDRTIALYRMLKERVKSQNYKGNIELRIYTGPLYCQMWIKDGKQKSGLAHVNIINYHGFRPHFRITPTSSNRMFGYLIDDFETCWNSSNTLKII